MSTIDSYNILSTEEIVVAQYSRTQVTPRTALATDTAADEAKLWDDALDRMLEWRKTPEQFEPEDAPDLAVLDTAIDYAVDERTDGGVAPVSIVPSGNGRVAFEWHSHGAIMLIEFVERGRAVYTRFVDGKVEEKGQLVRDPKSRKLELSD